MFKVKVRVMGNGVGIVLPKELMARLRLAKGDSVLLTECPGGFQVKTYNPEFERQMASAREVTREQRDVLGELAK